MRAWIIKTSDCIGYWTGYGWGTSVSAKLYLSQRLAAKDAEGMYSYIVDSREISDAAYEHLTKLRDNDI